MEKCIMGSVCKKTQRKKSITFIDNPVEPSIVTILSHILVKITWMTAKLHTFLDVPDINELRDIALPEKFLDLRMPVSDYAFHSYTTSIQKVKTSLQTFFLHVVAPSHFITLSKKCCKMT